MPRRAAYERAKAAHRCPDCGSRTDDTVYCAACRGRMQRQAAGGHYARAHRAHYRAEGRCVSCGAVKPDVRGQEPRCDACRAAHNGFRKQLRDARRRLGLCVECGNEPANGYYAGLGAHCSERHARSKAKHNASTEAQP